MNTIFWTVDDVLALHDLHLKRYGGSAGIRDRSLLESAVAQAQAWFGDRYLHADFFEMSAAYLFSIVKNHPSVDGNKRAGLAAALTFLDLNGITIDHSSDVLYDATMAVAEGRLAREGLAEVFGRLAISDH